MEKINIAELLKDCPKGMELYSPIFGNVYLDKIRSYLAIVVTTDKEQGDFKEEFLYDGRYKMNGECMLFPSKYQNTWEGFVPPCTFKDGDVIYNQEIKATAIFYKQSNNNTISHCFLNILKELKILHYHSRVLSDWRLATEEEKQKLFDAIKENGYKWNAETKTLEKLTLKKSIASKFKVGDKIKQFGSPRHYIIKTIESDRYRLNNNQFIRFEDEHRYELVYDHDKFDITTLKPFDSTVLVRDSAKEPWKPEFFGCLCDTDNCPYMVVGGIRWKCCIPYENNEHLLGTTDDCDNFYKTWK
jgi:hypothetical protein